MSSVTECYASVFEQLQAVSSRYDTIEQQLSAAREQDVVKKQLRIENLEIQLKKIDEYWEKVTYFRQIAEKHLESKNILTITPRELNFNRLRNWVMMMDPTETDDPYAQRIYVQTKCNEMFLRQKREEFERSLAELTGEGPDAGEMLKAAAKAQKQRMVEECRQIVESEQFDRLAAAVMERHGRYVDHQMLQPFPELPPGEEDRAGFGVYAQPLPVLEDVRYVAKAKLGDYYDSKSSSILLPVDHGLEKEVVLTVCCSAAKEKKLYRGVQNYLLNIISRSAVETRKITWVDGLHFNNSALGFLKPLEGTRVIDPIPRGSEQVMDTLKQLISTFSDIDETLGVADSVHDFNAAAPADQRLTRTLLVLIGYPSAFSSEARNYVRRILLNHDRYGVSVILVDTQDAAKRHDGEDDAAADLVENIYRIHMTPQRELIRQNAGSDHHFRWYELRNELPESFVTAVKSWDMQHNTLGTEYVRRIDMENIPPYERGKKSIVLPYGVDAKDQVHSISFDNENFASYLMGASGSGKSTLLHTLITGILRDYHPDDVELWLADFKMSEFAQYIDPMPPHVKYILLDESRELVYDLMDRLTDKMMERQRFFMRHRDMKKVENVPKDIYMPVIFVILDEFSIMSQAVSESETYKLRLQNLLAKGRALGIKFIFASQTFTKGVAGLTQTAKDQIQTRIAMKNSYSEINETLELSSSIRTEQVKNWMEALPPHYALSKYREGEALHVKRLQVMYFKGKGDETLEPQRRLIRHLNDTLHAVPLQEYRADRADTYVDKHPVIVDGNSFMAFPSGRLVERLAEYKERHTTDIASDDLLITFGTPRKMVSDQFAVITNESRENILLVARSAEQACGMSIIMAAIKSFACQEGAIHIWAYYKNRLYRAYRESHFAAWHVAESMSDICREISEIKARIGRKETGNDLVVMLGMEQICSDFDLIDFGAQGATQSAGSSSAAAQLTSAIARTAEQQRAVEEVQTIQERFKRQYDLDAMEDEWIERGMSLEEIMDEEERLYATFLRQNGYGDTPTAEMQEEEDFSREQGLEAAKQTSETTGWKDEGPLEDASYNALEDFKYIVKQGSRFGYHFMLCLNTVSDIKSTHLQPELFRHKVVFQIAAEDSLTLFASNSASRLPEHVCQYSDTLEQYSLRPFIHEGISWDGWDVDADGNAVSSLLN